MSDAAVLSRQRCFHHAAREAVCRCTGCLRSFCRECAVDHEGRLLCAACLTLQVVDTGGSVRVQNLGLWLPAMAGFAVAWTFFYMAGQVLLGVALAWDEWRPR
jgi:hypothetical protein